MKPLKIINFFDSIPKINSYSHYGNSLEKMFKMSSLKYFIKTLKFKDEFHKRYIREENAYKKKKEYDIYEMEGLEANKYSEEPDIFSLPLAKTIPKKYIKNNDLNKSYFYHKKKQSNLSDSPDALKYNPNYNSISKNIPSVRMVKPFFDKSKLKFEKSNLLNSEMKKNLSKFTLKDIKSNKYLSTIDNDSSKNSKINLLNDRYNTIESLGKDKRFMTEIPIKNNKNFYKNNSCKKYPYKLPNIISSEFPHYMLDKNTNKKRIRKFDLNNNTISFYNKNRTIDFRKMLKRSSKLFINVYSLKVPNSGYYEPKYNSVEKRQYNILINKKPIVDKHKRKQILLKKIMTSYYIAPNYQLIDNNKLNDDALKKLNL
jgi:hypothetical protein